MLETPNKESEREPSKSNEREWPKGLFDWWGQKQMRKVVKRIPRMAGGGQKHHNRRERNREKKKWKKVHKKEREKKEEGERGPGRYRGKLHWWRGNSRPKVTQRGGQEAGEKPVSPGDLSKKAWPGEKTCTDNPTRRGGGKVCEHDTIKEKKGLRMAPSKEKKTLKKDSTQKRPAGWEIP